MVGGIIGDIIGSIYEFRNIKTKKFELFGVGCDYTDDTILTVATAKWLLETGGHGDSWKLYFRYGFNFPNPVGGYGTHFKQWVERAAEGDFSPYGSCGNGSAMRGGPVGWAFNTEAEVLKYAKLSAESTHNHPEGIKGAQAVALAILWARQGVDKDTIAKKLGEITDYELYYTCDEIRDSYTWGGLCQNTVPQAIMAFLDGSDFEDCIRNAISLGGDSDTLACITGSIAEAYYGIPQDIYDKALGYLPETFCNSIREFENLYGSYILKQ